MSYGEDTEMNHPAKESSPQQETPVRDYVINIHDTYTAQVATTQAEENCLKYRALNPKINKIKKMSRNCSVRRKDYGVVKQDLDFIQASDFVARKIVPKASALGFLFNYRRLTYLCRRKGFRKELVRAVNREERFTALLWSVGAFSSFFAWEQEDFDPEYDFTSSWDGCESRNSSYDGDDDESGESLDSSVKELSLLNGSCSGFDIEDLGKIMSNTYVSREDFSAQRSSFFEVMCKSKNCWAKTIIHKHPLTGDLDVDVARYFEVNPGIDVLDVDEFIRNRPVPGVVTPVSDFDFIPQSNFDESYESMASDSEESCAPKDSRAKKIARDCKAKYTFSAEPSSRMVKSALYEMERGALRDHFGPLKDILFSKDVSKSMLGFLANIPRDKRDLFVKISNSKIMIAAIRGMLRVSEQGISDIMKIWTELKRVGGSLEILNDASEKVKGIVDTFFCTDTLHAVLALVDLGRALSCQKWDMLTIMSAVIRMMACDLWAQLVVKFPFFKIIMKEIETRQIQQSDETDTSVLYKDFMASPLLEKLGGIVTTFFASSLFTSSSLAVQAALVSVKMQAGDWKNTTDFTFKMFDCVSCLIENFTKFTETRDIRDLFGRDPVEASCEACESFTSMLNSANHTRLAENNFQELEMILDFRKKTNKRASEKKFVENVRFSMVYREFLKTLASYQSRRVVENKGMVAIMNTGPPGIGKSTGLLQEIASCMKARDGIQKECDIIYYHEQDVKHHIVSPIADVFCFDDCITDKEENREISYIAMLQGMIEPSHPMHLNTASLEEKARAQVAFHLGWFSTNTYGWHASKMISGFDKADRRVYVMDWEWRPEAIAFAKKHKVELKRLHVFCIANKLVPPPLLVNWTIGYMDNSACNSKNKNISLAIKEVLFKTSNKFKVIAWVMKLMEGSAETIYKVKDTPRCEHGLPSRDGKCICDEFKFISDDVFLPQEEVRELASDELEEKADIEDVPLIKQGAFMSTTQRVDVASYVEQASGSRFYKNLASPNYPCVLEHIMSSPDRDSDWVDSMITGLAIGMVIRVCILIIKNGIAAYNSPSTPEGNVCGVVVNVPNESSNLPAYLKGVPPYAGKFEHLYEENVFGFVVRPTVGPATQMFITFVAPNVACFPKHMFEYLDSCGGGELVLKKGGAEFKFSYNKIFEWRSKADLMYYYFHSFVKTPSGATIREGIAYEGKGFFRGVSIDMVDGNEYLYARGVETKHGDCGTPYFDEKWNIVGIHAGVVSTDTKMMSAVKLRRSEIVQVFKEFEERGYPILEMTKAPALVLQRALATLGPIKPPGDVAHLFELMPAQEKVERGFDLMGKFPVRPNHKMSGKETEVFKYFSHLLKTKYANPWTGHALASANYSSPYTRRFMRGHYCDQPILLKAAKMLVELTPKDSHHYVPLTMQEALAGVPNNTLVNGIRDDTSVGYFHSQQKIDKKNLIKKVGENLYEAHTELLSRVETFREALSKGEWEPHVIVASLKDEMLKQAKVDAGGGRLFYVGEKALLVLMRQYLLPILQHLSRNWRTTGCATSINPGSPDWGEIFSHLFDEDRVVNDGDFKDFDVSHGPLLFAIIWYIGYYAEYIMNMSRKDAIFLRRLLLQAQFHFETVEGFLAFIRLILTSGRADTVFINCLINRLLQFAWIVYESLSTAERKMEFPMYWEKQDEGLGVVEKCPVNLIKDVRSVVLGDDYLLALARRLAAMARFSAERYRRFVGFLGYGMTRSDKSAGELEWKEKGDASIQYLKRQFVFRDGRMMAPLAVDSMAKTMCYVTGLGIPQKERNLAAWKCVCKELFMHDEETRTQFVAAGLLAGFPAPDFGKMKEQYDHQIFCVWLADDQEYWLNRGATGESGTAGYADHYSTLAVGEKHIILQSGRESASLQQRAGVLSNSFLLQRSAETNLNSTETSFEVSNNNLKQVDTVKIDTTVCLQMPSVVEPLNMVPATSEMQKETFGVKRLVHTEVTGVVTASYKLSQAYFNLVPIVNITKNFVRFRGVPSLRIVCPGSASLQGRYRVFAVPRRATDIAGYTGPILPGQDVIPITSEGFSKLYEYRGVDIDISKPTDVELPLYWNFPQDYIYCASFGGGSFWDFTIYTQEIYAPLNVYGLTPSVITMSHYVCYEDVKFLALIPQMAPADEVGLVSSGMRFLRALDRSTFKSPFDAVWKYGERAAMKLGMSRLPDEPETMMIQKSVSAMSPMSGVGDQVYHTGADHRSTRNMDSQHLPGQPMGDLKSMFSSWGFIRNEAESGLIYFNPTSCGHVGPLYYPTRMATAALLFKQWRGKLELKVQFTGNPLVRSRWALQIYGSGVTPPGTYVSNGSVMTQYVDVIGSMEIVIEIPYLYNTKWTAVKALDVDIFGDMSFQAFMIEGPFGPSEEPPSPTISLFLRGGSDFEVSIPSLANVNNYIVKQGAVAEESFGESISSLSELCKRSCYAGTSSWTAQPIIYPVEGIVPSDFAYTNSASTSVPRWTYFTFVKQLHLAYSGSVIHRHLIDARIQSGATQTDERLMMPCAAFLRTARADGVLDSTYFDVGSGYQLFLNGVVELSAEDRSRGQYKVVELPVSYNDSAVMNTVTIAPRGQLVDITLTHLNISRVHLSAGDDVMFSEYMPITLSL